MCIIWLIVLLIYGWANSFAAVPTLAWWLLLPMALQDSYDHARRR